MIGRVRPLPGILLLVGLAACHSDPAGPGFQGPSPLFAHLGEVRPEGPALRFSDVWGYVDPATGKEYALLGTIGAGRMFVIDVSDPSAPTVVAEVPVPAFDIKVRGQYAYSVTGSGDTGTNEGRIVDLSDPANPVVVGSFPSSHNITIDARGYLYLEFPGLRILDLNPDPIQPALVATVDASNGHDATVVGTRLYDFHGSTTYLYDVSQPAAPALLGQIEDPTISYHHSGWPTENGRYLYLPDELAHTPAADVTIWDIVDPEDPIRVGSIADLDATAHNVYIIGSLAYVSYYSAGFRVYNVSEPASPVEIYHFDTSPSTGEGFVGAFGVYPFAPSGRIYLSDMGTGLHVFSGRGTLAR